MKTTEARKHPFTWPGGYTHLALVDDSDVICHPCLMNSDEDQAHLFVHWEGPPLFCNNCGAELVSEYGDPEEGES